MCWKDCSGWDDRGPDQLELHLNNTWVNPMKTQYIQYIYIYIYIYQAPSTFQSLLKLDLTVNTWRCFAYRCYSLSRTLTVTAPDLPVCTGKRRYYPQFVDESSAAGGSSSIVQMDMPGSGVRLANLVLLQGSSSCDSNENKKKRKTKNISGIVTIIFPNTNGGDLPARPRTATKSSSFML